MLTAVAVALCSCQKSPQLEVRVSDKYKGNSIELINYLDSTIVASSVIQDGTANLVPESGKKVFTAVVIDGKTRGFYVVEPGNAVFNDSLAYSTGTPLNNEFARLLTELDSVEQTDDMDLYLDYVGKAYSENKSNPLGDYFAVEWLRYADSSQIDSLFKGSSEYILASPKAKHYLDMASLREMTAPGMPFIDFEGEDAEGKPLALSSLVEPGKYTVVDFWASWCPYCIKEIPQLKALKDKWEEQGLVIVGAAVRDLPEDTKGMVEKKSIDWPVIYNCKTKPYEIYGFSGIPHHILIGPDGKIISRGENVEQLDSRLASLLQAKSEN